MARESSATGSLEVDLWTTELNRGLQGYQVDRIVDETHQGVWRLMEAWKKMSEKMLVGVKTISTAARQVVTQQKIV